MLYAPIRGSLEAALRTRAAENGRSVEAEVRDILTKAVGLPAADENPPSKSFGDHLLALRDILGDDELLLERDRTPVREIDFGA